MRKTIIGNWKMFKTISEINIFKNHLDMMIDDKTINVEYGIAVPSIYLQYTVELFKDYKNILILAQDAHYKENGAYTGCISYTQLLDVNVDGSLIGHSERRTMFNETDEEINKKVMTLSSKNLTTVLCVGESLDDYKQKVSVQIVISQLKNALEMVPLNDVKNIIIAYEPVWAIGTGIVPNVSEIENMITEIRNTISSLYNQKYGNSIRVLYGGSVNINNIDDFLKLENLSGFLVGSASLKGNDFTELLMKGSKYE